MPAEVEVEVAVPGEAPVTQFLHVMIVAQEIQNIYSWEVMEMVAMV